MNASVGEELPERRRLVTAADVAAYAEAGGDRNPLHLDDAFARSVGFDGVIAHGMFTMGHMATAVTAWAGPDATTSTRPSPRFDAAPVSRRVVVAPQVLTVTDPLTHVTTYGYSAEGRLTSLVQPGPQPVDR